MKNPYAEGSFLHTMVEDAMLFNRRVDIQLLQEYQQEFTDIFHVAISPYWDNLTGFDILKFDDEFIHSAPDECMADVVRQRYGERAVAVIQGLIGVKEEGV